MKTLILTLGCAFTLLGSWALCQEQPRSQPMTKLGWLLGEWKGTGWIVLGPGKKETFSVKENIAKKLGGEVLVVEGLGTASEEGKIEPKIVHQAYGVFSYDNQAKKFRFHTYRAGGLYKEAKVEMRDKGFTWGFDQPEGKIRYSTQFEPPGTWTEKGEFSRDGKQWFQFMEMTLQKVK